MKGIVNILNEEIPEHTFQLYNYNEILSGEVRIHYYTDLLILELTLKRVRIKSMKIIKTGILKCPFGLFQKFIESKW